MRAIVVDDSRTVRKILARTLHRLGYEVLEAEHGRAALDVLESQGCIDIGLIDWNMPVMNGISLVRELRQRSEFDDMLLMMVTTESQLESVNEALDAGVDEFLMKPFDEATLISKLELLDSGL